jgi:uracil-DNA glycosylase family 4
VSKSTKHTESTETGESSVDPESSVFVEKVSMIESTSEAELTSMAESTEPAEFTPKAEHAQCGVCPLKYEKFCGTAFPTDPQPEGRRVAFVSRSPGKHDVRAGVPFAGPSGKVLDFLLKKEGWNRGQILTTNVVLCQSDDPPIQAIRACKPRLDSEIADFDLILTGGTEAASALTKYRSIARARGFTTSRTSSKGKRQRVVVTNNPAAVMRNSDLFPDMLQDFRRAFNPPPPHRFPEVEIIDETDRALDVLTRWFKVDFGMLAADLEWTQRFEIAAAGFARTDQKAIVFGVEPLGHPVFFGLLKKFLEQDSIKFIWHNGKSDTKVLHKNGIQGRIDEDTFLMSYALDERPGYHSLEYMLSNEFGWPDYEPASVTHFKKTGEFLDPIRQSKHDLYKYNGYDTAGTMQLYNLLRARIDEQGLETVYRRRLLPLATSLRTVESNGFHYDTEAAADLNDREVIPRLYESREKMQGISEHPLLNPRSPKQLSALMYGEWKLKHTLKDSGKKKFKTSVGKEVREEIEAGRFVCDPSYKDKLIAFMEVYGYFQKIDKQRGTYIEGLIKRATNDGKIYCHFNEGGTATGRVSSSEPNLQNITREGPEGTDIPGIRTLFLPSPGHVIVSADYSQAELRTCAVLSGERNLLDIYADSGRSLHKERAAAFYGTGYTKEQYVKSKNINFGVTYGQSAGAFAQMYHMPESEAQSYIDSWWRQFPVLLAWTRSVKRIIHSDSAVVESPFGFRRRFHLVTDENVGDCERQAVNFLPQNVAAWLTLSALVELVEVHKIRVVATVHDSIVADVPQEHSLEVAKIMKQVMESQTEKQLSDDPNPWSAIPFTADISIGDTWGTLQEVEL